LSHYEVSYREREDEHEQYERDFGVSEFQEQDLRDWIARTGDGPPEDERG
jgi:hypothetical protein